MLQNAIVLYRHTITLSYIVSTNQLSVAHPYGKGGGTGGGAAGVGGAAGKEGRSTTPGSASKSSNVLALFPTLIHLLGSSTLRPRVCDAALLQDVAKVRRCRLTSG